MTTVSQTLSDNLQRVRDRIAQSAEQVNRSPAEITLVAVTKYVGPELTAAMLAAGATHLGESRPQQLWKKAACEPLAAANWHLIGHLQRNKVRRTLPLVSVIHGVDSERLLSAIDEEAKAAQLTTDVLLEVNTSGDAAKHGLGEGGLAALLELAPSFANVRVRGLMTMAARDGGQQIAQKNFADLRALRNKMASQVHDSISLNELSMGMSGDFEQAIQEGATIVRVGSALWEGVDRTATTA